MKSPQRILYVVTKANFGGAQRYVFDLATNATAQGCTVLVALGGDGMLKDKLHERGIETVHIPGLTRDIGLRSDVVALRELYRIFRSWQPEVIHLNSSKASLLGAVAGRLARAPRIVMTAHGWPFFEERGFLWRAVAWFASWLSALCSDVVICVSEYDRTHALFPFLRRRLVTIYNGITPPDLLSRADARAALFSNETITAHHHDHWLVAISELHPNKNLALLIEAIATLCITDPNTRYFLTVMGDGELRSELEAGVARRKLSDSIRFLGHVDEPYRFLSGFDTLVMPSKKEGLPYTLLYGATVGIPIIASAVGGIPEIIARANEAVAINPDRPAMLLNALRHAAVQPKTEFLPHVIPAFSEATMVRATFACYQ